MGWRIISTFFVLFSASKSFDTIRLISDEGTTEYDYDKKQDCFVSDSQYLCSSPHMDNSWDLFQGGQFVNVVLSQTDGVPKLYDFNDGQLTEIDSEIKVEFVDKVLSMIAVGATGVGKSTLLNALLCPSMRTNEYKDCFFRTDDTAKSVTKEIQFEYGPWLGEEGTAPRMVKLYDAPGLGDSDGSDSGTLTGIVDRIISAGARIRTILLVFKATDRFSATIQRQLKTLEYILSPEMWNHVITVFTFWDFNQYAIENRIDNCIKERISDFNENKGKTEKHCLEVNFEEEKAKEWEAAYEEFMSISQPIPFAFPHPVFDFNNTEERKIFFEYAEKIYKESSKMSVLSCTESCQNRLEIALKNEEKLPVIIGREIQRFDAGTELYLKCHFYLGLTKSSEKELNWMLNSSSIENADKRVTIEESIVSDVIKESVLTISNTTFADSGMYNCSTLDNQGLKSSNGITVKVLKPCKAGFEHPEDSDDCEDVDECEKNIDNCEQQDICINTVGSWECCPGGHHLAGENMTCTDIDECKDGPGCGNEELCFNTVGSFVCCDKGYEIAEDNASCIDTNECEDPGICEQPNKECKNTEGSFECLCIHKSYFWSKDTGDCMCNQGRQSKVCKSCNPGAALVKKRFRVYCTDQVSQCNIYDENIRFSGKVERIAQDFPNIDQAMIGYNILRGDPVGFNGAVDPGFSSSPIFGYTRKDHLNSSCSFKGYNPNIRKQCQGSSTSLVFTTSEDLLDSLKQDVEQEDGKQEITFSYNQAENAMFTNSKAFGADIIYSSGKDATYGNTHCVDRAAARSVEVGESVENNHDISKTNEETNTSSESETSNFHAGFGKKRKKRAGGVAAVGAVAQVLSAVNIGGGFELSSTNTDSETHRQSTSHGWRKQNSQSNSYQNSISTKFCDESNYAERQNKETGNRTNQEDRFSTENQVQQSFTIPAFSEFVKNSGSISKSKRYFEKHIGAIAITKRDCSTYELNIETQDPPTFTDPFKQSIQDLHDLTLQTKKYRMSVVKTGIISFNTSLNSTTERLYDAAFSNFIKQFGTHYLESVTMGGQLYVKTKIDEWTKDSSEEDDASTCFEEFHQSKFRILDLSKTNNKNACRDPNIKTLLQNQSKVETEELHSIGAPFGSEEDAVRWSTGKFDQPAKVAFKLQPIIKVFLSRFFISEKRIVARDGVPIDANGIFEWFNPRFTVLTDSCRALINYKVSTDFSKCEECPTGQGPTEDFRECKTCDQLVGHRFSNNHQSCERCPEGQWPDIPDHALCKPCNELNGVRFTDNRKSCIKCRDGLTPSEDSTSCLDCTLDDHQLNDDGTRCKKCPSGTWPSKGFECKPCSLLDNVRFSPDKTTCLKCPPGLTPSADSSNCLDCSKNNTFFTNQEKTRCDICPGGQGASSDHFGCERRHGQWKEWGPWSSCSINCVGKDGRHGTRSRRRNCTDPEFGGDPCDKEGYEEVEKCGGPHRTSTFCPVDGVWSSWREWGTCSRTCGGGKKTRERFCRNRQHGGRDCPGSQSETKNCNPGGCPVDGYWNSYGSWSSCSKTCGGGEKYRTRTCNQPRNGGKYCSGDGRQTTFCNIKACEASSRKISRDECRGRILNAAHNAGVSSSKVDWNAIGPISNQMEPEACIAIITKTEIRYRDRGGCFPGNSLVKSPSGTRKRIQDIQTGDLVESESGKFLPVLGWLDISRETTTPFLYLHTNLSSSVGLTASHVIFTYSRSEAKVITKYARDLAVGDILIHEDTGNKAEITKIDTNVQNGFYSPLTSSGTLVVDGYLVSCYASYPHQVSHAAVLPIRTFPSWFLDDSPSQEGVGAFLGLIKSIGNLINLRNSCH